MHFKSKVTIFLAFFTCYVHGVPSSADKKLLIFAVTTELTDGYLLFLRSLKTYGLQLQKLLATGQKYTGHSIKVNLLNKELEKYKDRPDIIVLFTDTYDVIFTAGEERIIQSFLTFGANVVFSAETNCSPDPNMATYFPQIDKGYRFLNSGGFIGYAPDVYDMLPQHLNDDFDDQLYYTFAFLDESFRNSRGMVLDTQAVIFQSLHGAEDHVSLVYNDDDTTLVNHYTNTTPSIIHGNGNGKLLLHTFSSYLAKSWIKSKGCLVCDEGTMDLNQLPEMEYPKVLMGVFIDRLTPFLEEKLNKISGLLYPKKRIFLFVYNKVSKHEDCVRSWFNNHENEYDGSQLLLSKGLNMTIGEVRDLAIKICLDKSCEAFFSVDSEVVIEDPNTLNLLVSYKKTAIAPLMSEPGTYRSTFWGGITDDFHYVETFDYKNIVDNKRRGIWNVPQLFHIYLIWRYILENPFYVNGSAGLSVHPDIAISHIAKITKNFSMFLYVVNIGYYGRLAKMESVTTEHLHNDLWQVATNPKDWKERYLHPRFHEELRINSVDSMVCPDVFLFPLFKEEFCRELTETVDNTFENRVNLGGKGKVKVKTPNTVEMNIVGYENEWSFIVQKYVKLISEKVFNGYHSKGESLLDFIVRESTNSNSVVKSLQDIGTYTVTVALNSKDTDYKGGEIDFLRYNCTVQAIPIGWAMIHPARLTHYQESRVINFGTRYRIVSHIY